VARQNCFSWTPSLGGSPWPGLSPQLGLVLAVTYSNSIALEHICSPRFSADHHAARVTVPFPCGVPWKGKQKRLPSQHETCSPSLAKPGW